MQIVSIKCFYGTYLYAKWIQPTTKIGAIYA